MRRDGFHLVKAGWDRQTNAFPVPGVGLDSGEPLAGHYSRRADIQAGGVRRSRDGRFSSPVRVVRRAALSTASVAHHDASRRGWHWRISGAIWAPSHDQNRHDSSVPFLGEGRERGRLTALGEFRDLGANLALHIPRHIARGPTGGSMGLTRTAEERTPPRATSGA